MMAEQTTGKCSNVTTMSLYRSLRNESDVEVEIWKDVDRQQFYSLLLTVVVSFCIAILDLVCVLFLMKSSKLQKSRFHFLTLCLSIGDFMTMIFVVILLTNTAMEAYDLHLPYLCVISSSLVYSSILFSLFQTLIICIERYFATSSSSVVPHNLSRLMLKKTLMIIIFTICLLYTVLILVGTGSFIQAGCLANSYSLEYSYWKESPIIVLLLSIIMIYLIVIHRLRQMLTKVSIAHESMSDVQFDRRVKRLKLNIFTLGLILITLSFGTMPRIGYAFIENGRSGNIGNIFLLLPPLINPFIYVLRFLEFRRMWKPRCCVRADNNTLVLDITQFTTN